MLPSWWLIPFLENDRMGLKDYQRLRVEFLRCSLRFQTLADFVDDPHSLFQAVGSIHSCNTPHVRLCGVGKKFSSKKLASLQESEQVVLNFIHGGLAHSATL